VLAAHRGLVVAAALGFLLALVPALPGGEDVLTWVVAHVPGGGLLRDSQKWLAPYVVVLVLCAGAAVQRLVEPARRAPLGAEARLLVALSAAVLPLLLLPDAPREVWPAVHPVSYPADLARAVATLDRAPASSGDAVTLPWASYRRFPWGNDLSAADPVSRWADHTVVVRSDLAVPGSVVRGDDPRAAAVGDVLRGPRDDLVPGLRALGVGWVLVHEGSVPTQPSVPAAGLPGLDPVVDGPDVTLYRIAGVDPADVPPGHPGRRTTLLVLDLVWLLVGLLCAAGATLQVGVMGGRSSAWVPVSSPPSSRRSSAQQQPSPRRSRWRR
jgi:hypothetical protein